MSALPCHRLTLPEYTKETMYVVTYTNPG